MTPIQLTPDAAEALANGLQAALLAAESDRAGFLAQVRAHRALLRTEQPREDAPWEGACDLHVPLLRYFRNAFLARVCRGLLSPSPIHFVEGRGGWERQYEGAVEAFLYEQERRVVRLTQRYRPVLANTFDDGTGAVYLTWETRAARRLRYLRAEAPAFDEAGNLLTPAGSRQPAWAAETIYDGPRLHVLPIEHVGVYPAASLSIAEAQGVYVKLSLTGNELLTGAQAGLYDPAAVALLRDWPADTGHAAREALQSRGVALTGASYDAARDFHALAFDIVEWYWRYAPTPEEPATDWLITLHAPTRTLLRAQPNPWGHGRRPIVVSHVLPPKFGILGESLADLAGNTQRFVTLLLRQLMDAMALRANPELAVGSGITPADVDKWLKSRGPGRIRKFNAEDVSKVVQPLAPGLPIGEALPLLQLLMAFAERATGFNNALVGQQASRAVTATELERMLDEGQELIMDMTDTASSALAEVGELLLALDYEYSGHDSVRGLWALANPALAGVDVTAVLGGCYDVSAAGITATVNRTLRKQQAVELFAALKGDPFVNADPTGRRQYTLRRLLLTDGFGYRNPENLIGSEADASLLSAGGAL